MAHLYKASEWEVAGKWYIADTSDLGNDSAAWWIPARIIGISLTDYILLLQNEYHAVIDKYCPDANNKIGKSNPEIKATTIVAGKLVSKFCAAKPNNCFHSGRCRGKYPTFSI